MIDLILPSGRLSAFRSNECYAWCLGCLSRVPHPALLADGKYHARLASAQDAVLYKLRWF